MRPAIESEPIPLFDSMKLIDLVSQLVDAVLMLLAKGGERGLVLGLALLKISLKLLEISVASPHQFQL